MIPDACEPEELDHKAVPANTLLDSTFNIIAHVMRSRRCSFMLLDSTGGELRIGSARGLSAEIITRSRAKLGESIAGLVASRRLPLLLRDLKTDPEVRARALGGCKTDSILSVPVEVGGKIYGVLNVTDKENGQPFDELDLATLSLLAAHMALCIENGELQAQIQRLANADGLTEVYNHRYFHERLTEEVERANRFGRPVSLMMIDVNGFKEFNDRHGHPAGDVILREIAAEVRRRVRHLDLVSRYGGDEFTVILPETDGRRALQVANRISRAVATHRFLSVHGEDGYGLTVSTGVSTYPTSAGYKQELIAQADKAMYAAKQGGFPHIRHWEELKPCELELAEGEALHAVRT